MFLKEITKYVIDFDQFKHVKLIFTLFIQVYFSLSHVFCLLCTQFACLVYEFFDCQLFEVLSLQLDDNSAHIVLVPPKIFYSFCWIH